MSALQGLTPNITESVASHYLENKDRNVENSWNNRVIIYLSNLDDKLDKRIPNIWIQNKIDEVGRYIEKEFEPLEEFNKWLDINGIGSWYKQLATFLYKLPLRALRNIIRLLYSIIKGILYTTVHPLKSLNKLAKLLPPTPA